MTVKVTVDKLASIVASISKLATKDVLVGIPDSKTDRTDDAPTNATIGYLQEYGSDAQGIPPRPFLNTGVEESLPAVMPILKQAALASLDGSDAGVERNLNRAGLTAQNSVKNKINSGDFIPLSEATLRARAARGRKGAKIELARRAEGEAPSTEYAKPLIDTGQLRNSISYVIRGKK